MDMLEIMKKEEAYCSDHRDMPGELQKKAKMLCWRYNQTSPEEGLESFFYFSSSKSMRNRKDCISKVDFQPNCTLIRPFIFLSRLNNSEKATFLVELIEYICFSLS